MININKPKKSYLFLQGPHSNFFHNLGKELESLGHKVRKINFNGGDLFFWSDKNSLDFSDEYNNWPNFLKDLDKKENFTDLIIYGDCRYFHKKAIEYFRSKQFFQVPTGPAYQKMERAK